MDANRKIVGKCGLCGGPVTVPALWWSPLPAPRTCDACGATADPTAGRPTFPMRPPAAARSMEDQK